MKNVKVVFKKDIVPDNHSCEMTITCEAWRESDKDFVIVLNSNEHRTLVIPRKNILFVVDINKNGGSEIV